MQLKNLIIILVLMFSMQGCSTEGGPIMDEFELPTFGSDRGSEGALEVPPDLDLPETKEAYDIASARESASGAATGRVLPQRLDMQLRSEGNITWLTVGATPDGLWSHLLDFWRSYGFELVSENMLHGRIETDWREQRLSAGSDLRVRDMFHMRVERAPFGATNIYLANRKATLTDGTWKAAFSDRETEVDILYDLSDYLASQREVKNVDISPLENVQLALDIKDLGGVPVLTIGQPYSQTWRRLGVSLDRAGLDVRRVDRSRGIYLIRYDVNDNSSGSGLLQLRLLEQGDETLVTVHSNQKRSVALPYETAHEVLQRIVRTYQARRGRGI